MSAANTVMATAQNQQVEIQIIQFLQQQMQQNLQLQQLIMLPGQGGNLNQGAAGTQLLEAFPQQGAASKNMEEDLFESEHDSTEDTVQP